MTCKQSSNNKIDNRWYTLDRNDRNIDVVNKEYKGYGNGVESHTKKTKISLDTYYTRKALTTEPVTTRTSICNPQPNPKPKPWYDSKRSSDSKSHYESESNSYTGSSLDNYTHPSSEEHQADDVTLCLDERDLGDLDDLEYEYNTSNAIHSAPDASPILSSSAGNTSVTNINDDATHAQLVDNYPDSVDKQRGITVSSPVSQRPIVGTIDNVTNIIDGTDHGSNSQCSNLNDEPESSDATSSESESESETTNLSSSDSDSEPESDDDTPYNRRKKRS